MFCVVQLIESDSSNLPSSRHSTAACLSPYLCHISQPYSKGSSTALGHSVFQVAGGSIPSTSSDSQALEP